jgi:hypothetical protein
MISDQHSGLRAVNGIAAFHAGALMGVEREPFATTLKETAAALAAGLDSASHPWFTAADG